MAWSAISRSISIRVGLDSRRSALNCVSCNFSSLGRTKSASVGGTSGLNMRDTLDPSSRNWPGHRPGGSREDQWYSGESPGWPAGRIWPGTQVDFPPGRMSPTDPTEAAPVAPKDPAFPAIAPQPGAAALQPSGCDTGNWKGLPPAPFSSRLEQTALHFLSQRAKLCCFPILDTSERKMVNHARDMVIVSLHCPPLKRLVQIVIHFRAIGGQGDIE